MSRVAIVGAGISALRCARLLGECGITATLFDKARGPGGRMATRRAGGATFDHGAQYFTARDPSFVAEVAEWRRAGVVQSWGGRIVQLAAGACEDAVAMTERFVGVPRMSALTRHLAAGHLARRDLPTGHAGTASSIELDCRVIGLRREESGWVLSSRDRDIEGRFDAAVVTVPAPQAVPLLEAVPELAARAASIEFAPCQAAMVEFDGPLDLGFDGAFVQDSALSWVARDSSKPGRPPGERWVLHGSPEWSRRRFEARPDEVIGDLVGALRIATGRKVPALTTAIVHRWAYALPLQTLPERCMHDDELAIGVCGDWCAGPRVEGAFLSGSALAARLLARLG